MVSRGGWVAGPPLRRDSLDGVRLSLEQPARRLHAARSGRTAMTASEFPRLVRSLPAADLPFPGLRGWLLQSESGLAMFNESDADLTVPEHSHGDQWGVVIDGRIELTIGGRAATYARGDTYFIPAGTPHSARIHAGFRALDFFADRNRYRARPQDV